MIISASRRTDIPAFYPEWLAARIQAGYCLVPNPFNSKQISRVSLRPEDVDGVVLWSKNPDPMIRYLPHLDRAGISYCFLYTLNDYPAELEPNLPPLRARMESFRRLSGMLGADRVDWRYDPIVLSNRTTADYHRSVFERLCRLMEMLTTTVRVSPVTFYKKTSRRLGRLENDELFFDRDIAGSREFRSLLRDLAAIARSCAIEIVSCATDHDYGPEGVASGGCIDGRRFGVEPLPEKDPGQRAACLCTPSRDIGVTDTCMHGCRYCYSTTSNVTAARRNRQHDPAGKILWSARQPADRSR